MSNHKILFAIVAALVVVCLPGCGASLRNGDFSEPSAAAGEVPGWKCQIYDINPTTREAKEIKGAAPFMDADAEHGRCFRPKLKASQRCVLSGEAVKLAPLRLYELRADAFGARAVDWNLRLIMREPGGERRLPLFPYEAYEPTTSPPMAWVPYRFLFLTGVDASDASVESVFETLGNAAEPRPAVAGFALVDHGKAEIVGESPLNFVVNPGLEQDEKLAWRCDNGQIVEDGGAHGGKRIFRIGKSNARADWGSLYLDGSELLRVGVWARGGGSFAFALCPYAAAKSGQTGRAHLKLPEQHSPEFELSGEWRYFSWEFPVCQLGPYPPRLFGAGVATRSANSADFDDAELWRASLRLPEKFRQR